MSDICEITKNKYKQKDLRAKNKKESTVTLGFPISCLNKGDVILR